MNLLDLPSRAWARWRHPAPVVAVVRLDGIIGGRGPRSLSLLRFAAVIERAFRLRHLRGVALAINSPGGSPAQSQLLYRRIRQLADEHRVPVFAFAEDVAASGGYWLALAADEIYAEESSLVGSIGVVSAGFGLSAVLQRFGVERRLYTAGENKSLLDPFLPENPRDVERLGTLQRDLHDSFKELVHARRGGRLKGEDEMLMSGEIFAGRRALAAGLIDGIGDLRGTMRERFGDEVRLRLVAPTRRRLSLLPFGRPARPDIADVAADMSAWLEERLLWSRFGL
ncbi:MAG TPA: S49 family peptidase [Stellaceae bacterium]|nr:S49 family peptidase [Stellaceae bacterium]